MDITNLPEITAEGRSTALEALMEYETAEGFLFRTGNELVVLSNTRFNELASDDDSAEILEFSTGGFDETDEDERIVIGADDIISISGLHSVNFRGKELSYGTVIYTVDTEEEDLIEEIRLGPAAGPIVKIDWAATSPERAYSKEEGEYIVKYCMLGRSKMRKKRYSYHLTLTLPDTHAYYDNSTVVVKKIRGGGSTNHWMKPDPSNRSFACHQAIGRRSGNRGCNGFRGFVLVGKSYGVMAESD